MSTVEIDGVAYEVAPQVAGLLQAVSEERDELRNACECALAATKTAAIRAGAKAAGWCDTNGNWPLHNMLAKALKGT
jgi:hypothetical protein